MHCSRSASCPACYTLNKSRRSPADVTESEQPRNTPLHTKSVNKTRNRAKISSYHWYQDTHKIQKYLQRGLECSGVKISTGMFCTDFPTFEQTESTRCSESPPKQWAASAAGSDKKTLLEAEAPLKDQKKLKIVTQQDISDNKECLTV